MIERILLYLTCDNVDAEFETITLTGKRIMDKILKPSIETLL
jgi:hypothetical protein